MKKNYMQLEKSPGDLIREKADLQRILFLHPE
jgi:hypothetical protein